jgi:hypothetical protein
MKHISFPSIEQYRNTCFDVSQRATYTGKDAAGDPTYNESLSKPTIVFTGTVKLHGTNASVCYNLSEGLWIQSRENIITEKQDNAGFARFVGEHYSAFMAIIDAIYTDNNITDRSLTVALFGEWCGGSIQKGVGISNLPKSFFIFGAKVLDNRLETPEETWLSTKGYRSPDDKIYNVEDYANYEVKIDFNDPSAVSEYMQGLTLAVEEECPIAKAFGFSGVGEGIVWKAMWDGKLFTFKVKGLKHQVTKVKNAASAVVETVAGVAEFVEATVTEARFNQAIEKVCGGASGADTRKMGDYLRWFAEDIQKEESDTLAASGLTWKDVSKAVNEAARNRFLLLMQS